MRMLDEDEAQLVSVTDDLGRNQDSYVINESGLYTLILKSNKSGARKFRRWVTKEVLPQIRKTGAYGLTGKGIPVFVRRFNENWDRVDRGYFSVISELFIRVYGKLEQVGYIIPDYSSKGKEIRPDVSVGKGFPMWLEKNYPELINEYKTYKHIFPNGLKLMLGNTKIISCHNS